MILSSGLNLSRRLTQASPVVEPEIVSMDEENPGAALDEPKDNDDGVEVLDD